MATTRSVFAVVQITATKRQKDASGKWRQRTKKFYQTLNPFNTKNGRLKTYSEIMVEITKERDEWMKQPIKFN